MIIWSSHSYNHNVHFTSTVEPGVHGVYYVPLSSSKKDPHKVLKLKEITNRELKVYEVERDCALGEFIKEKCEQWGYQRGRAFYELTDKSEDVYKGQEIILQKKVQQNEYVMCNTFIIVNLHSQQENCTVPKLIQVFYEVKVYLVRECLSGQNTVMNIECLYKVWDQENVIYKLRPMSSMRNQ